MKTIYDGNVKIIIDEENDETKATIEFDDNNIEESKSNREYACLADVLNYFKRKIIEKNNIISNNKNHIEFRKIKDLKRIWDNETTKKELRPCPFCGSKPFFGFSHQSNDRVDIICSGCGCRLSPGVVEKWNTRIAELKATASDEGETGKEEGYGNTMSITQ